MHAVGELHTACNRGDAEEEDGALMFSPELGNVAFASAADGWGFRTQQFAAMYASKLGAKEEVRMTDMQYSNDDAQQ